MVRGDDGVHDLLNGDGARRGQAVASLIRRGDKDAVSALTDALLQSHWPVCDELADALARIGTDAARQGLLRALKGRRHHIRSAAVKALAGIGGAGVRDAVAALAADSSYEVRQDVAEALVLLDGQELRNVR